MATKQPKRRKAVRRLLWVIVAAGLTLVLLPVWFPWALRPVLKHYDLGFAGYDRIGYTHFALRGVTGRWESARLEAKYVECVLPTAWFWRRFVGSTNDSPLLCVRNGDLTILRAPAASGAGAAGTARSIDETMDRCVRTSAILRRVLPAARLTNCTIEVASHRVLIRHADWRNGRLRAIVGLRGPRGEIEFTGRIEGSSSFQLSAIWEAYGSSLRGNLSRASAGWRWEGEAMWLTNRAEISAQFNTNGWWPAQARLECREFSVPAKLLPLYGYEDLVATLAVNLSSNQFDLQATGVARPSSDFTAKGFPAAHFRLAAEGNPDSLSLRTLGIESPVLNVALTSPVVVTWNGALLTNAARFQVVMDLGKLPGAGLTGRAEGLVRVEPHGARPPSAQFTFSATNIHVWRLDGANILLQGEYDWPELRFDQLGADWKDGSKLSASGSFDFKTRRIVNGDWRFSAGALKQMLPGMGCDELTGSGQLGGPLTNLAHRGGVTAKGCHIRWLKALNANVKWSGRNLQLDPLNVELTAAESSFSIEGAVDLGALDDDGRASATLTKSSLRRGQETLYVLQRPCALSFHGDGMNAAPTNWALAVDALDWQGGSRKVALTADLSWPAQGNLEATITNVALGDFSDFLAADIDNLSLARLVLAAHWSNGPVHSAMFVAGALTNRAGETFVLRGALRSDDTVSVDQLSIEYGSTPTMTLTGKLPVKVSPGHAGGWFDWDESQDIALTGNWVDHPARFSLPLAPGGKLEVTRPELHVRIFGKPEEPAASVRVGAAIIAWQSPTKSSLPSALEDFQLRAEMHSDRIKLDTFTAKLEGQTIEATGEWPLSAGDWQSFWLKGKLPDWSRSHARLQMEDAQIAALSRYLPQALAPEGKLSAKLELNTGKRLDGALSLTNAATRALGEVTPLRDIAAEVSFNGHRAVLEKFRGRIGGQPILADGFVAIRNRGGLDYEVNLHGTNVPLARSPELLLRGDFDLRLRGGSNLPPVLSGGIHLHDGLYLQHASALVWSGPKRPELCPPYFSVTNEPLANWILELGVSGDRFLRVRTPLFGGLLSAHLKLNGSLGQPVLTGDVRVNSGRVLFPFGTLSVDQGYASFSGNDPQGPDVQFSASGRNYRYDLQLEAKGPVNVADVTFSSTPPLTSQQILLLLTAGELPQTDFAFSREARAGRLTTFLGKDLLSRFFDSTRGEERLIIRTGEGLSEEGRLSYSVEYRLTDRWSIIGEYDEFNAFNTDLKWKILAR